MTIQQNLTAKTVSELKAEAARVGCTGTSKLKKAELAQRLAEYLSQPEVMQRTLLAMEEPEFKQFKKALRTPAQGFSLPSLERLGYASGTENGLSVLCEEMGSVSGLLDKVFYDTRRHLVGLNRYLSAFSAFYGVITLDAVRELLTRYDGKSPESLDEDAALLGIAVHSYVLDEDRIMHAGLTAKNTDNIAAQQKGKPRAVLNKSEILRYADPDYCCRPAEQTDFCGFLRVRFGCTNHQAAELTKKVCQLMQIESHLQPVIDLARADGLKMEDLEDVRDFSQAYEKLNRHYPLWIYCGYTAEEIEKLTK